MTVSVIIPVYNAASFIEKAVNSVLQFPEVEEVLLIEDGSNDHSLDICKKLSQQNPKIKTFTHPNNENRGVSASRNKGMDVATKEFVAFLDADDYWLSNRFEAERKYFENPKIDGVFGAIGVEFVNEKGKEKYLQVINDTGLTTVKYAAEGKDVFYGLTQFHKGFGTFFSMIALTVRKTALENPKLRLNESLEQGEDKDFIVKLSYQKYLKSGIIDKAVSIRTAHENNTITKVKNFSTDYFLHQSKLHQSLYQWAKNNNEIPKEILSGFKYKFLSQKIAAMRGFTKYFNFFYFVIFNPKLLKTRYRYYALKNNSRF